MTDKKEKKPGFSKPIRILALVTIILLAGMYLVTLIAALIGTEAAKSLFVSSLYCTFIVPILIYFAIRFSQHRNNDEK